MYRFRWIMLAVAMAALLVLPAACGADDPPIQPGTPPPFSDPTPFEVEQQP